MKQFFASILLFIVLTRFFPARQAFYLAGSAYTAFLGLRTVQFLQNLSKARHIPGHRYVLTPWGSLLSLFLPPIKYVNAPLNDKINDPRRTRGVYEEFANSTIYSIVSAFSPRISLRVADPVAIKAIVADRKQFPKPLELYRILAVYGENIVITEGEEWRKHRRVVGPSFSEKTYDLVWEESTKVAKSWMDSMSKKADQQGIAVEDEVSELGLQLALNVICSTAFGVSIAAPGQPKDTVPDGHQFSFKDTLEGAMATLFINVATPKWLKWLPVKKLDQAKLYKSELDSYMHEMVHNRRKELSLGEEQKDLLSTLVKASAALKLEAEASDTASAAKVEAMDDEELIGNMFIFLLAGHETSAHTMAFAFGLLALYPEEQDQLYAQIKEVMPDDEAEIPYSDYPLFTRALAIMNETLRIFPSVIAIPKRVTTLQDTILPCSERGPKGATRLFLPAGTHVSLEVQAMHHDPYLWPEPEVFRPDRFIDTDEYKWNRDAFIPFSAGARSCVGQKFSQVEVVCILVTLCRRYRIKLLPEDLVEGESLMDRQRRVLRNRSRITLTPLNLRLAFERR